MKKILKKIINLALIMGILFSSGTYNFSASATPIFFPQATAQEIENKNTELGFGFYSMNDDYHSVDFLEAIQSKSVNTSFISVALDVNLNVLDQQRIINTLNTAKLNKSQIFFIIFDAVRIINPNYNKDTIPTTGNPNILISDWQQRLINIDMVAKNSGAYSAFAGFYIDEPFCYEDMDLNPNTPGTPNAASWSEQEYVDVTKFIRENFDKRVFTVYNRVSFDKEAESYLLPTYKDTPDVSPYNTMYITDIGIDLYGNWADSAFEAGYRSSYAKFKQKIGTHNAESLKFWHLPATISNSLTLNSETIAISHFNGMKQMLSEETNKGGLMCYYWGDMQGAPDTINECFKTQVSKAVSPWINLFNLALSTGADYCSYNSVNEVYSGRATDYEASYGGSTIIKISGESAKETLLARGSKVSNISGIYSNNIYFFNKNNANMSNINGFAIWIKSNLDLPLIEFQLRSNEYTTITNGSILPTQLGYSIIPANIGYIIYIEKSSPFVDDTAFDTFINGTTPYLNIITNATAQIGTEMIVGGIFAFNGRSNFDQYIEKITIFESYSARPSDYEATYGGASKIRISGTAAEGTLLGRASKFSNISGIYANNIFNIQKNDNDLSNINCIAIWVKSNYDLPLIEFQLRSNEYTTITNGSILPTQLGYSIIPANVGTWLYLEKSSSYIDDTAFESFVNGNTPYLNLITNATAISGTEMTVGAIYCVNDKNSFISFCNTLPIKVSSLAINSATLGIYTEQSETITSSITPSNATNQTVVWSSNNTAVATVSQSGLITGVTPGQAIITAISSDGWFTQTCLVTVSPVLVTGVGLDFTNATIGKQVTKQLTATVSPSNAYNKAITWTSSDPSVATVSTSGLVTAVAVGTATITATTVDGSFTANCSVTVTRYDSTRDYKITYASGSTLAMDATNTGLNGVVKNVTYTGATSQQWKIIATTDSSTFKVVNKATGYALKVNSTYNSKGKQIIQTTYANANNMNFTISDSGTYVRFVSKLGSNTYIKSTGATGGTLITSATNTTTTRWVITLLP